ncbi:MAG: GGDEF domain-containing protein [Thiohalobacteraceae bacterium]
MRDTDTVARMGGDEFVVLLESIKLPGHAALVSEAIRNALAEPAVLYGRRLCILPSIGVAIYPEDGEEEGRLLRHADEAMYAAKAGRNKTP